MLARETNIVLTLAVIIGYRDDGGVHFDLLNYSHSAILLSISKPLPFNYE